MVNANITSVFTSTQEAEEREEEDGMKEAGGGGRKGRLTGGSRGSGG